MSSAQFADDMDFYRQRQMERIKLKTNEKNRKVYEKICDKFNEHKFFSAEKHIASFSC